MDVRDGVPEHIQDGCLPETRVIYLADLILEPFRDFIEVVGIHIAGPMEPLGTTPITKSTQATEEREVVAS